MSVKHVSYIYIYISNKLPYQFRFFLNTNDIYFIFVFVDLAALDSLEILDLSWNQFIGSIPPSIRELSSLKSLSLSKNHLNGSLPTEGKYFIKI